MTTSLVDAFELITHAELLEERLARTATALSEREGLNAETTWLDEARRHVASARAGIGDLLTRVLRLEELAPMKMERGRALQTAAVDAVEQLQNAIVDAGGPRSPLLEALFRNVKLVAMRRTNVELFADFCREIDRRLGASYAKRMLADETYATVDPALREVQRTFEEWRSVCCSPPMIESEAADLRSELESTAQRLERPCRQARLLAEASLLPTPELLDESGIFDKPKRRAARPVRIEAEASFDPSADAVPTSDPVAGEKSLDPEP